MKFKSVLVIDDSYFDRLIATEIIRHNTATEKIVSVESALDGLDYLQANENKTTELPEIIFLDIKMPKIDGFGFLEKFNSFSQAIKEKCKIYVLSSSIDPDDINKVKKSKYVVDFIEKPLTKDKINHLFTC